MSYSNVWAEVVFVVVVFQKRRCLHKLYYAYCLRIIKVYHLTKFQVFIYSG